ncbi:MAG: hypothetical protein KBA26_14265 [Candidatus Delongbacteria bacterium]|nr:hypothetical protein [Candidatus Delongbacteria bacterium]
MKNGFLDQIRNDLKESQIDWKVIISFIPIAFLTYLFHELGHWALGEMLGNDMTLTLNNSTPKNGCFIHESHALWSAIGGPLFTIIQAGIFLLITGKTKSVFTYSMLFMAVFSRFFSIVFGGINRQDEARIASMLPINHYIMTATVLIILGLIWWKGNRIMELNLKASGYFVVLGVVSMLMVIGVNATIRIR